jgi:hypothetical protein
MPTALALVPLLLLLALPAAAKERVVTLKLGPFRIEANRDREVCQAVRIPRVRGMEVVSSEVRSRTFRRGAVGTHHFIAYGYRGASSRTFPAGLADDPGCNGFGPGDFYVNRVSLAGSGGEQRRGQWLVTANAMPAGLSQPLPNPADAPDEAVVVLNSHYFNLSPRPARGFVRVKLRLAPADPGKRVLRQVLAVGASRTINVPPGATGSETDTWQADGRTNLDSEGGRNPAGDVCLLYLTGHMHLRGTRFVLDYERDGQEPERRLDYTDYVHPTVDYYLRGRLLPAYTAENGWPRFRYTCEHANGVGGKPIKMGCEETPGVVPGMSWVDAEARGISILESHARPCGLDAANCTVGTGRCVPANLVFGPLSDDDMCILVGTVFDPLPGLPPDQACAPSRRS